MSAPRRLAGLFAVFLPFLTSASLWAAEQPPETVGSFTAVQGKVFMTHRGAPASVAVNVTDDVRFKAVIETQPASKTKALFLDDTLLTIGERSRVEITEQIYDPAKSRRSTVMRLVRGQVRALVGRIFEGAGSRFEVHTPTAVAAARGTHFVVWIDETPASLRGEQPEPAPRSRLVSRAESEWAQANLGPTGLVNVGEAGNVDFTSGGKTVIVKPKEYSLALPGQPPSVPTAFSGSAPPQVGHAMAGTFLRDMVRREAMRQIVQAIGITEVKERVVATIAKKSGREGAKVFAQTREGSPASGAPQGGDADVSTSTTVSTTAGPGGPNSGTGRLITPPAALSDALPDDLSPLKRRARQLLFNLRK